MPLIDGYTATALIRTIEVQAGGGVCAVPKAHVPIIALTAFAMAADRVKCLEAGMDDYLTKPLGKSVLLKLMDRHGRSRMNTAHGAQLRMVGRTQFGTSNDPRTGSTPGSPKEPFPAAPTAAATLAATPALPTYHVHVQAFHGVCPGHA